MSQDVEIVHKAGEAFNRQDVDALVALSHEDLEFVSALTAVEAGGGTYRGLDTWAEYFAAMDEAWEEWRVEDLEVFDAGEDRAAGVFRLVGTGDGKLWRMHSYLDPAEAFEAVGLRE